MSIAPKQDVRSLRANAYLWGVCYKEICNVTEHEDWEIHEVAKQKFLPHRLAICDGNGVEEGEYLIGATTTKLTPEDFGHFIEKVRQWAAEFFGIVIPDPDGGY